MTISTIDGLIAAAPGQHRNFFRLTAVNSKAIGAYQSMWGSTAATGQPGAAAYPSASTTWVVPTSSTAGAIPFTNPVSANSYLAKFSLHSSAAAIFVLYDRLAHTGAITPAASTQSLTTTPLTRPDALGADVEIWWEWITASGATPSDFTCSYTNQVGTASRTTQTLAGQTSSVIGQMQPFGLQSGDTGVRSVESFTGTGAIGGTGMLVLLRKVAEIQTSGLPALDAFATGMPRIYDSACLSLLWSSPGSNSQTMQGSLQIVQG